MTEQTYQTRLISASRITFSTYPIIKGGYLLILLRGNAYNPPSTNLGGAKAPVAPPGFAPMGGAISSFHGGAWAMHSLP